MTTFPQLVDEMIAETKRPDLVLDICAYVNQTIREMHFTPDKNNAILFRDNMRELALVADAETGFSWTIPNESVFQMMRAVRYDSVAGIDGDPVWAKERNPGRAQNQDRYFYYRAAGYYAFAGYGGLSAGISLAYYEYPRRLKFYGDDRPATWDEEDGWAYADGINTAEEQAEARAKVTNWLLMRWGDVIREGVRAKVYKRTADETRGRTCYSLYQSLRNGVYTGETVVGDGAY